MQRALAVAFLFACAGGPSHVDTPHSQINRAELDRFIADENRILLALAAADPRFADRTGAPPSDEALRRAALGALLAEDTTAAVEGNRTDLLSFDVREHATTSATKVLAAWKTPPAEPSESTFRAILEIELLQRLLASETLRVKEEREMPRLASALLDGLAATWRTPADPKDVPARDEWLARRLGEMTQSLAPKSLSLLERDALDDSIDPVERAMGDTLPKSMAALVKLRLASQHMDAAAGTDRWAAVATRMEIDLGSRLSADTLLALFKVQAQAIEAEIKNLVGIALTEEALGRASDEVIATPPCAAPAKLESRVRALAPPPERAFECSLAQRVITAKSGAEVLDMLAAMHQATIVASWAVVLARGGERGTLPVAAPRPLMLLSPDIEGKLLHVAASRPVFAIGHALAVDWLMRKGLVQAAPRASAWRAFGDAPLDVIEHEVRPDARAFVRETQGHAPPLPTPTPR